MATGSRPAASHLGAAKLLPLPAFLLCLCFFLSGFSALVYQVAWSRLLVRVFGASLPAVSTILSVFMGGLALGAYLAGRADVRRWQPLKIYALIELAVGLYALAVPFLFSQAALQPVYLALTGLSGGEAVVPAVRLCLVALVLFVPTALMGATLPVLSRLFAAAADPAREVGYLYSFNTGGAFAGAVAGGFFLVPALGLSTTIGAAAAVNIAIGAAAWRLSAAEKPASWAGTGKRAGAREGSSGASSEREGGRYEPPATVAWLVVVATLSGALFMILEVAWTRFFSLVLGSTTYAFSAVLALVLLGLAAGSYLAAAGLIRLKQPLAALACVQLAAGLYIYESLMYFNELPYCLIAATRLVAAWTGGLGFSTAILARVAVAGTVVFVPALMLGAIFPIILRLVLACPVPVAAAVGRLYAANTAGAIAGAWLAGFILIPRLSERLASGLEACFVLVAWLEVALAVTLFIIWLAGSPRLSRLRLSAAVAAVVAGLIWARFTLLRLNWNPALISSGASFYAAMPGVDSSREAFLKAAGAAPFQQSGPQLLFYREGANTTVTVGVDPISNVTYLKNDGKVEAAVPTDPSRPAPSSDMATQVLLALAPALIHPGRPENVFVVGYGTGTTVGALLSAAGVKSVRVAEIERAVLDADPFFRQVNNSPLGSPAVSVAVADARQVLTSAREPFDLIVSQPADPWVNGMSDLFTREFWELGRSRLAEGGLFAQWIQLYAITPEYLGVLCRTFCAVFPECLMFHPQGSGEIILVGCKGRFRIDAAKAAWRASAPATRRALLRIGLHSGEEVLSALAQSAPDLKRLGAGLAAQTGNAKENTDDNLLTEYQLPRTLFTSFAVAPENRVAIERYGGDLTAAFDLKGGGDKLARSLSRLALACAGRVPSAAIKDAAENRAMQLGDVAVSMLSSPYTLLARAEICRRLGRDNQAGKDASAALAAPALDELDLLAKAIILAARGQDTRAEALFKSVCRSDAASGQARYAFARFLIARNRAREATAQLVKALELDPLSPEALTALGAAELSLGNAHAAVEPLKLALALDAAQFKTRIALGAALIEGGSADEGLMELKAASYVRPDSAEPYLRVAAYYAEHRLWQAAWDNLALAAKRAPDDTNALIIRAVALAGVNDNEQALAALTRYNRLTGKSVSPIQADNELRIVYDPRCAVDPDDLPSGIF